MRKQLLINKKNFDDLKKIYSKGKCKLCSDSQFIRVLIEDTLKKELKL